MSKVHPIPPVPSYYDLMALFRVVAEPELYAAKLAELEKLRTEINAGIERRESLSQIETIKAEHAQLLSNAKATRDLATAEAKKTLQRAKDDAAKRIAAADARAAEAEKLLAERSAALDRRAAELEMAAVSAAEQASRAQADLATAKDRLREAEAIRAEYESKAEKLRGLVA